MKLLVVGPGAREHALVRSLSLDPAVTELHAAPGNPGIAALATCHPLVTTDPAAVAALAVELGADLVVVGPEAPLVAGVADAVRAAGIACFGPSAQAAQLEGSKAFAKDVMAAAGVPTGASHHCTALEQVATAIDGFGPPYVVKDDGLAAGKGVVVTSDRALALEHAQACFAGGASVVVEEFLDGPEVSLFCLTDGETVVALAPAQDFKRALDGDEGPNTGGMGAYSPLPWAPEGLVDEVRSRVAQPTINEMARRGTPFVGVLYCGLALTSKGVKVIEFNARFGDPETQVVLARLATPLAGLLTATATGALDQHEELRWRDEAAVTVVVAAHGYPEKPRGGDEITGLADADQVPGAWVLHAGTRTEGTRTEGDRAEGDRAEGDRAEGDRIVSSGGRVLSVVGTGGSIKQAREVAYEAVAKIHLADSHHRTDIAANR